MNAVAMTVGPVLLFVRVLAALVTVVLAMTIGGESLTLAFLVGGALVILGVYVGALSSPQPPSPDTVPEA